MKRSEQSKGSRPPGRPLARPHEGIAIQPFELYTGKDNASHVLEGTLTLDQRTDVIATHFEESPPHSAFDWRDAPESQYLVTLAGTLEFTTATARLSSSGPVTSWWQPTRALATSLPLTPSRMPTLVRSHT